MSFIFNLKAGDSVRLYGQDCWRKILKAELRPEKVGIAQTIRLWFEDGEAGSYCHDGEVSGSTAKKYFHDIVAFKKSPQEGQIYQRPNGEILLITSSYPKISSTDNLHYETTDKYYYITPIGKASAICLCVLEGLQLIAEFPTWKSAIKESEYFKELKQDD